MKKRMKNICIFESLFCRFTSWTMQFLSWNMGISCFAFRFGLCFFYISSWADGLCFIKEMDEQNTYTHTQSSTNVWIQRKMAKVNQIFETEMILASHEYHSAEWSAAKSDWWTDENEKGKKNVKIIALILDIFLFIETKWFCVPDAVWHNNRKQMRNGIETNVFGAVFFRFVINYELKWKDDENSLSFIRRRSHFSERIKSPFFHLAHHWSEIIIIVNNTCQSFGYLFNSHKMSGINDFIQLKAFSHSRWYKTLIHSMYLANSGTKCVSVFDYLASYK